MTHLCFFQHLLLSPLPPFFVPLSSQADPAAEKKEDADPANQAEVLHTYFLPLLCIKICQPELKKNNKIKICSSYQTAKEEEEKEDDGMWEETFKTFVDSKPNGKSLLYFQLTEIVVGGWVLYFIFEKDLHLNNDVVFRVNTILPPTLSPPTGYWLPMPYRSNCY